MKTSTAPAPVIHFKVARSTATASHTAHTPTAPTSTWTSTRLLPRWKLERAACDRLHTLAAMRLKALLPTASASSQVLSNIDPQSIVQHEDGDFSYVSARLKNGVVVHNQMREAEALRALLQRHFPEFKSVSVGCDALEWATTDTAMRL